MIYGVLGSKNSIPVSRRVFSLLLPFIFSPLRRINSLNFLFKSVMLVSFSIFKISCFFCYTIRSPQFFCLNDCKHVFPLTYFPRLSEDFFSRFS